MKTSFFKRNRILLCAILAASAISCTQQSDIDLNGDNFLYEITGKRVSGKSYIIGIEHTQSINSIVNFDKIDNFFTEAGCLITETDITTGNNESFLNKNQFLLLPDNISYSDLLPIDKYYELDEYLFQRGLGKLNNQRIIPFMLQIELFLIDRINIQEGTLVENHFINEAKSSNKQIAFLEDNDYQFEIISMYFQEYLNNSDESQLETQIDNLMNYIDQQNSGEYIFEIPDYDFSLDPTTQKRNREWVKKIRKIINKQQSLIIVGKLHLQGKHGLINLFEKKGYEIKPVF